MLNRFSFVLLLSSFLCGIVKAEWHWEENGIEGEQDPSMREGIDWVNYPSSFESYSSTSNSLRNEEDKHGHLESAGYANQARKTAMNKRRVSVIPPTIAPPVQGSTSQTVSIRYYDDQEESFKTLDTPFYRSDSIGQIATRAAEMTQGAISPDVAALYLEGVELYNHKAFKYFIHSVRNGGRLTLGYSSRVMVTPSLEAHITRSQNSNSQTSSIQYRLPSANILAHNQPLGNEIVNIRYWSYRWGRWVTLQVPILGEDRVQDIINKLIEKSHGELNSSSMLYLDEFPLPKSKRLYFWFNEIRNGGVLEAENNYSPKKPRNPYNSNDD